MNGTHISIFASIMLFAVIAALVLYFLFRWLYVRSSKDRAFVRTGLGGQRVVLDGGAFVLPVVHEVTAVHMGTVRLEVARGQNLALITKDRMRVDVTAEFYVRVRASRESVAAAAQTLGHRSFEADRLRELIEGKFIDALRTAAATMALEELHEHRGGFVKAVRDAVADDLAKNGLELEAASLTQLDQTPMEFFNPNNTFDAEGLTRLTEQIERRKKERNEVEQSTLIAIRNMNLEAEKQVLEIERESEYARISQQREVEFARVRQRSEIARERAEQEREAEQVQIAARQAIDTARIRAEQTTDQERIYKEQELQSSEIARRTALDLAEQQRTISIAERSKAQSEAQAAADAARAGAVAAEEKVLTMRETEAAERRKAIDLIGAAQAGEKEALRLRLAVDAERGAAHTRGEAILVQARAEAEADRIRTESARIRAEADAEATRLMNEAQNVLSPEARMSGLRLRVVDKMESIIRESVKPMERIEGIKILNVHGLGAAPGSSADSMRESGIAEQVVNSALRYRAQAPLIDSLLREIGVEPDGIDRMAHSLLPAMNADKESTPVQASAN